MSNRSLWLFQRAARQLWFRATAFSAIAVAAALLALVVKDYIPYQANDLLGADAAGTLLNVLAASMLSVTIFSLSTLVSALSAAASGATPRAVVLVMEDDTAQNALAIFLGSFLFSLVGIIALQTGLYGDEGRVILFVVTLAVIAVVIATMLKWIDHVTKLGRVGETLHRLERAAAESLTRRRQHPHLDGTRWLAHEPVPARARAVHSPTMGYVQHVDMSGLQQLAQSAKGRIHLVALPGAYVDTIAPVAWFSGATDDELTVEVCRHLTVGEERSFDQDPRFAVSVLSEVASRALSPAVNDPGTAIDVLGRLARLLSTWADTSDDDETEVQYPDVHVRALSLDDLFDDAFVPIARDGAALVEVAIRLQKVLRALSALGHTRYLKAAQRQSTQALARAKLAMALPDDVARVQEASDAVTGLRSGDAHS